MNGSAKLAKPRFLPPLDEEFRPAILVNQEFRRDAAPVSVPLIIGLERNDGRLSRYETRVFPDNHPRSGENLYYAERMFKFLLWQRGGKKVFIGGPHSIGKYLQDCYSPGGARNFDYHFMSEQVYEQPLIIELCEPTHMPESNDRGEALGYHLEGYRIGFDLGASDRKVSAVVDGQVVFSEEVIWDPRNQTDPNYHYREIMSAINTAAAKMQKVEAIGGSSAGIYINNRPMVASLFRSIPHHRYSEIKNLFLRIRDELDIPLEVINDGDVAALAGSMSLEDNGILGIAMGSSQAAGYIDLDGHIMGWLNELAFAPVDYNPLAPVDEWSGDIGCGSQYFSQQCVFRLAPRAGIQIPENIPDAEKLKFVQDQLAYGHEGAVKIWQSMGIYLGYALALYADFYEIKHALIMGRCTSGLGGALMIDEAQKVLREEFPNLSDSINVQLPDERNRRIGQAIAAASLPKIDRDRF